MTNAFRLVGLSDPEINWNEDFLLKKEEEKDPFELSLNKKILMSKAQL